MTYERLIEGYVAHAEAVAHDQPDTHSWAYRGLHALAEEKADAAWLVVVEVIKRVADETTLNYVGADILEDLLCDHANVLIDRVEALAEADQHLKDAVRSVWGWSRMPQEIRARLDRIVGTTKPPEERGRPTSGCS